jgi:MFS family permease
MAQSLHSSRWFALGLILLARISMAMQFQSIAPVAPLLVADLALSYAELGLLIGLYLLPGAVLALPGGLLGERFGNRRVVLWALALMVGGGLLTAASHSLWQAGAGRLVSGAGGVLLTLVLAKMTAEWFAGKEISTAMGVMLTGWPFGIALATALFGAIAAASSWRSVQHVAAALATIAFVLLALLYRDAPGVATSRAALRFVPDLPARGWVLILTAGVVWMLFNVGFIVLVGFGPGVLVSRGATLARAGFLVSLAVWVSSISVPLGGVVVDRSRRPDLAIAVGCLLTALAIAATPLLLAPVVWLLVAGVMAGLPAGAMVALVPRSVRPEQLAAGFGVFFATYYLGMAALQPVAGLLRDLTGSAAAPLFFAAAAMALAALTLGAFRWIERPRRQISAGSLSLL